MRVENVDTSAIRALVIMFALAYGIVVGWFVVPHLIRTVVPAVLQSLTGI